MLMDAAIKSESLTEECSRPINWLHFTFKTPHPVVSTLGLSSSTTFANGLLLLELLQGLPTRQLFHSVLKKAAQMFLCCAAQILAVFCLNFQPISTAQ